MRMIRCRKVMKYLLAGVLMLTLVAVGPVLAAGPAVGDPAPDYTLPVWGGGTFTLSDYQGKVVQMFVVGYG